MTRDDIIRMAREAGFADGVAEIVGLEGFARFAALVAARTLEGSYDEMIALVAAAEREACARVADKQDGDDEGDVDACIWSKAARHIAAAIRARGEQK